MEVQWECVILELMRLQDQVERLQASIDEMSHARSSLTVVNEDTESGEARLRVG
jgi:prefoldin subunit 5